MKDEDEEEEDLFVLSIYNNTNKNTFKNLIYKLICNAKWKFFFHIHQQLNVCCNKQFKEEERKRY